MNDVRQRKANLRLAQILASVALAFGIGFVVRLVWLGR
jgi:hypothetical protein